MWLSSVSQYIWPCKSRVIVQPSLLLSQHFEKGLISEPDTRIQLPFSPNLTNILWIRCPCSHFELDHDAPLPLGAFTAIPVRIDSFGDLRMERFPTDICRIRMHKLRKGNGPSVPMQACNRWSISLFDRWVPRPRYLRQTEGGAHPVLTRKQHIVWSSNAHCTSDSKNNLSPSNLSVLITKNNYGSVEARSPFHRLTCSLFGPWSGRITIRYSCSALFSITYSCMLWKDWMYGFTSYTISVTFSSEFVLRKASRKGFLEVRP